MSLTDQQLAFALSQRVAHLATADLAGVPHVIPICFAIGKDRLYFVIDEKPKRHPLTLKRLRNIAVNPQVALVIDRYQDDDWEQLAFLRLQGVASAVEDDIEYALALDALRARYPQYTRMGLMRPRNPMHRVDFRHAHFWCAGAAASTSQR